MSIKSVPLGKKQVTIDGKKYDVIADLESFKSGITEKIVVTQEGRKLVELTSLGWRFTEFGEQK